MEQQMVTISTKGQLVIPAEMRASLGILPGMRVALTLEENRIIVQPIERLVDELRGMFAEGPSLEDELYKERRSEKW